MHENQCKCITDLKLYLHCEEVFFPHGQKSLCELSLSSFLLFHELSANYMINKMVANEM